LIRLTDWVQGKGQGYSLTPAGETVLEKPRLLDRLRAGVVPRPAAARPPLQEERPPTWERTRAIRDALTAPTRPRATLGLLAANVAMFLAGAALAQQHGSLNDYLATSLSGGPMNAAQAQAALQLEQIRLDLGAMTKSSIMDEGQWWRLLTTCFVHIGVIHLAMNMYALWVLGPLLERMWGTALFLLLYMIAGLVGSAAALIFPPHIGGAGASGAICGLLGAMAAWVYLNTPYLQRALSASWMRGILINGILVVIISMIPGVSWAGHFGGCLGGLVAAVPLIYTRFGHGLPRWLGLLGALLVPAVALGWLDHSLTPPTELGRAQRRYAKLIHNGRLMALATYYDHVVKIFNKGSGKQPQPITPEEAQAALAEVGHAVNRLKKLSADLEAAPTYDDVRINQSLTFAKQYAADLLSIFEEFQRALDGHGNWNREEARRIPGLVEKSKRDYERFRDSVLSVVQ